MTQSQIVGSGGGKGGGDVHTPVEAPDNLLSISKARILDLISEGEIRGLVDGLNSIYLNETPLATDGTLNFSGVSANWCNGTQSQPPIPGFPAVENTTQQGIELKASEPFVRDFTNLEINAVRVQLSVPQLFQVSTSNGDTNGYTVAYAIDLSVDSGPYREVVSSAFSGKTTTKYERSHDIVLPAASDKWTIRVRRSTPNSTSSSIADTTVVESTTEIIYGNFSYPNSAVIGTEFSAANFQGIPSRAYDIYGMIVRVPTNYDPDTRTYSGVWDGSFKRAWTDNPAWIFLDLVTNARYGLGDHIPLGWMDKSTLYQISRFCDELVPDGFGGQEPRFVCNAYIQDREEAFDLVQKLASVFQGLAYYASGIVTAVADQPKDTSVIYTNSDVLDGRFTYSGAPKSTRYTMALVGWNNPKNFYKTEIEAVSDQSGLQRYGYNETQFTAFACSSRGQAHRAGKWALLTSQLETGTLKFTVGLKGLKSRPGDVIQIADEDLIGEVKGGLIAASTLNTITTDCDFTAVAGDKLKVMRPDGLVEERTIQSVAGRVITVTANFSGAPQVQGTWAVEGAVRLQAFRVLAIAEKEGGTQYELTCLEYRAEKFDAIANGTKLDVRPVTAIPPSVQPPPTNVHLTQRVVVSQGIANTTATIAWDAAANAIAYEGAWRKDEGEWVPIYRTGSTSVEIPNIYAGRYVAQIRAINALGIRSVAAFSSETALDGKTTPPPVVTSLTTAPLLWGISLKWGFPAQGSEDVQRSEIWYSTTPEFEDATKLSDLAYPQNSFEYMGLKANTDLYFWVRLVDRSGNFGEFFPAGAGVLGSSSSEADAYLDAIRDEVLTTDLADQLVGNQINEALELTRLMDEAERHIREDEDALVNRKVEVLEQAFNEGITASIEELRETVTTADSALAQQITTLETRVDTGETSTASTIEDLRQTVATADAALSSSIFDLTSTVNGNSATISATSTTLADTNGKLSALYTLKSEVTEDGVRYFAGIGVGVENDPNGPGYVSQILFQADRLALLNTSSSGVTIPFAVQGGQVFMNSALIQDGSITTAKIGDATINNAKLTGPIYSANWVYGVSGWLLNTDGNLYVNNGEFRGNLVGANGTFSGTLTANAINAVSRLNIAGNSATISTSANWGTLNPVFYDDGWMTLGTVYLNLPEYADIMPLFFLNSPLTGGNQIGPSGYNVHVDFRILINGNVAATAATANLPGDGTDPYGARLPLNTLFGGVVGGVPGNNTIQIQALSVVDHTDTISMSAYILARYR